MSIISVTGGADATVAALLDAAMLIEQSGISGLHVSCSEDRVTIHVGRRHGTASGRAAIVAGIARAAGAGPARQHSGGGQGSSPVAWLEACGMAGTTVIEVITMLAVRPGPDGAGLLAAAPDGTAQIVPPGQDLPAGWRWVTELDDQPQAA
jgi:hypothetical protein